MTPMSEDRVRSLLAAAAEDLRPPPTATRAILDAAAATVDDEVPSTAPGAGRTARRVLAVAAAVLLVTAGVLAYGERHHGGAPPATSAPLGAGDQKSGSGTNSTARVQAGLADGSGAQNESYGSGTFGSPSSGTSGSTGKGQGTQPQSSSTPAQPARVVATGAVALAVPPDRLQAVVTSMSSLATRIGGYVASAEVHTRAAGGTAYATVVLRVPERRFASLVAAVQRDGTTTSVATTSSDVTGEVVDYQARIAAAEASRRQYLAILAKATTISAILSVQSQINQIQSEIEQLQGARNVLVNEAAYSTLTVSVNRSTATRGAESGLRHSWLLGVGGFVAAFELLVRAAGPTLFILLCLAIAALIGRAVWRATRRRML